MTNNIKNNANEKNNLLTDIIKGLNELQAVKDFSKSDKINDLTEKAINLYLNYHDKGGFLRLLFKWDNNKGWSEPSIIKNDVKNYFDFIGLVLDFRTTSQKLLINDDDFNQDDYVSFSDYKKILADNKKADKDKLNGELLKVKLPFSLDKLDAINLKALILQANLKLKSLKTKKQS